MNKTAIKQQFLLRDDITYLNFGSFGACVKPVFDEYQRFQRELEAEPVDFFLRNGPGHLKKSREALAAFLNCDAEDLVYVTNPSYAVNIVAKSLALRPGDEILSTDLEYGACDRTWQFCCGKAGATYKKQKIRLPFTSAEEIVQDLFSGVTANTRMIFVSHITSATALLLPVKKICEKARELGIPCFVDGAHAPGQVPLDLTDTGADMYTGACHKWMLTPKGCTFLHVRKTWQDRLDPLVVSWGYESEKPSASKFLDYHEGQGTRDYSAFLTVPAAIGFMEKHNWTTISEHCAALALENAPTFAALLGTKLPADPAAEFTRQMISIPVNTQDHETLQLKLRQDFNIEIPLMKHNDTVYLRYSINAFNDQEDLDRLRFALEKLFPDFIVKQAK